MQVVVPAFLEVENGEYKLTAECNYADMLAARKREENFRRRACINTLLRAGRGRWSLAPSLTAAEVFGWSRDE